MLNGLHVRASYIQYSYALMHVGEDKRSDWLWFFGTVAELKAQVFVLSVQCWQQWLEYMRAYLIIYTQTMHVLSLRLK